MYGCGVLGVWVQWFLQIAVKSDYQKNEYGPNLWLEDGSVEKSLNVGITYQLLLEKKLRNKCCCQKFIIKKKFAHKQLVQRNLGPKNLVWKKFW